MQTTDPNYLHVAVGLLLNAEGEYFIQQRLSGKPRSGAWEYPGGKIEQGEVAVDALKRELKEEIGIDVLQATEFMQLDYRYAHAHVYLYVFMVDKYQGQVSAKEGQNWCFASIEQIKQMDVLEAVVPINQKLCMS